MSRTLIGILLFITLSPWGRSQLSAQSDELEPVYTDFIPQNMSWSYDSERFVFQRFGAETRLQTTDQSWFEYNVITETLSQKSQWPLQPTLSQTEHQIFNPIVADDGRESFIFSSLDDRYIVFGSSGANIGSILMLGDRQTVKAVPTSATILDALSGPDFFNVQWSPCGEAFVVSSQTLSNQLIFDYVSDYTSSLANISQQLIFDFEVDGQLYVPLVVYDVSDDGSSVLLRVREEDFVTTPSQSPRQLAVWDAADPSSSQIINDFPVIAAASFAPNDDDRLLVVSDVGLVEFDLNMSQNIVIRPDISTEFNAIFSPDGNRVALLNIEEGNIWNLFIESSTLPSVTYKMPMIEATTLISSVSAATS